MTLRRVLLSVAVCLALVHHPAAAQQITTPAGAQPRLPVPGMPAAFADRAASGEALANAWFSLLARGHANADADNSPQAVAAEQARIRPYLDPAFQAQRASGRRYDADDYVHVDITTYTVSDVVTTEPGEGVKVVRYVVSTPGATAPDRGWFLSDEARPRLEVFRWNAERGHWVVVSIANFNTPTAAVCNAVPVPWTAVPVGTSTADAELGRSLVDQWRDTTLGRREPTSNPDLTIQLADGQGWPNPAGTPIAWSPAQAYEVADVVTTRNGDLLVVSFVAVVSGLQLEGRAYSSERQPRLLTYMLNAQGRWRPIALANFVTPVTVAAGVECATRSP